MFISVVLVILFSSCGSKRAMLTYFCNIDEIALDSLPNSMVRIEPHDELVITVNSTVPSVTAEYNLPLINPAAKGVTYDDGLYRIQTYTVNSSGDIVFPMIGVIHVEGMTTEELRDFLIKKIEDYVKSPYVKVDLLSYQVNVLGEVKNPGRVTTNRQRFSILEAISKAGDLTQYGRRDNILLIREMPDGERIKVRLDLNDAESLNSPYFYLKQNDYIYVEPSDIRKENAEYDSNRTFQLSVASTVVTTLSVIATLIVALAK